MWHNQCTYFSHVLSFIIGTNPLFTEFNDTTVIFLPNIWSTYENLSMNCRRNLQLALGSGRNLNAANLDKTGRSSENSTGRGHRRLPGCQDLCLWLWLPRTVCWEVWHRRESVGTNQCCNRLGPYCCPEGRIYQLLNLFSNQRLVNLKNNCSSTITKFSTWMGDCLCVVSVLQLTLKFANFSSANSSLPYFC